MLSTGVSLANSRVSASCERSISNRLAISPRALRTLVASFSAKRLICRSRRFRRSACKSIEF